MTLNTKIDYGSEYGRLHAVADGKYFSGSLESPDVVVGLVKQIQPTRILDYGSGKGYQYLVKRIHEKWGGPLPYCYDIGVRQLSHRPEGKFGGIINTDMMEHIHPDDVDTVLADIFSFADERAFAYFNISCIPSKHERGRKTLSDGRNLHLAQFPPAWWKAKLAKFERPGLIIESRYEVGEHGNIVTG